MIDMEIQPNYVADKFWRSFKYVCESNYLPDTESILLLSLLINENVVARLRFRSNPGSKAKTLRSVANKSNTHSIFNSCQRTGRLSSSRNWSDSSSVPPKTYGISATALLRRWKRTNGLKRNTTSRSTPFSKETAPSSAAPS